MKRVVESFTDKHGTAWSNFIDTETGERSHSGTNWRRADVEPDGAVHQHEGYEQGN